jgi:hypothetical protein
VVVASVSVVVPVSVVVASVSVVVASVSVVVASVSVVVASVSVVSVLGLLLTYGVVEVDPNRVVMGKRARGYGYLWIE